MQKNILSSVLCLVSCVISGTTQELKLPYYSTNPPAVNFTSSHWCHEWLKKGQPAKVLAPQKLDVRSCDISSWNLTEYTAQELADVITFDSQTKFPQKNKLPKRFSAKQILSHGKTPGLGVRNLHAQGITGKNVSIAVIDTNLLLGHGEYVNNVMYYENLDVFSRDPFADIHACAVASIAVGKSNGVAPQASLFAFSSAFQIDSSNRFDARPTANTLRHVAELNTQLPTDKKIRVVSISRGFDPDDLGADEFEVAKGALEKDGIAVFTTNDVFTLSRNHSMDDPEIVNNYCRPAYWFKKEDVSSLSTDIQNVIVPTDFRVIASPTGDNDYVHYANGGLSWAVPYVAGLYALGVQVYPQLTKEIFVKAVHDTATIRNCEYQRESFSMPLINPTALINYLKGLKK